MRMRKDVDVSFATLFLLRLFQKCLNLVRILELNRALYQRLRNTFLLDFFPIFEFVLNLVKWAHLDIVVVGELEHNRVKWTRVRLVFHAIF